MADIKRAMNRQERLDCALRSCYVSYKRQGRAALLDVGERVYHNTMHCLNSAYLVDKTLPPLHNIFILGIVPKSSQIGGISTVLCGSMHFTGNWLLFTIRKEYREIFIGWEMPEN